MTETFDILLSDRLAANVTQELRDAVERAAAAQDLTVADFVRASVSDRLDAIDVPHRRIPLLRRRPA